ncbi:plasma membrane calcium-transporting ATPase 2-like [Dermatophagoides pteronyssinus]|uniref:plasma membrane calcium-transporting ATPase 2-like n=1 Tax=Dermatophagoides pteronyssinus TaxID=6956 RepID=UPI003F66C946
MLRNCFQTIFHSSLSVRDSLKSLKSIKSTRTFDVTSKELAQLMEYRGLESIQKVKEFGSINGLCMKLHISLDKGLDTTGDDIKLRKQVFGSNKLTEITSKSFHSLIFEALQEKTMVMLEICALVSLALSFYHPSNESSDDQNLYSEQINKDRYGYIESVAIWLSIMITVFVMATSEYGKEAKFRALQNRLEKEHKINILRNGNIYEISTSDLVVGDICIIKYGDVIPADGILFEYNELRIDESSMTGESDLVAKSTDKDITMFAGTHVMEGSGRMIVIAVGANSQTGVIHTLMKSGKKGKSILQCKLADLAIKIGYFGISIAIITIVMLIVRSCIVEFAIKKEKLAYKHIKEFFDHVITGITILVVAVPEGLPLAVSLSLAYSVKQMMRDNNLVRHIDACETMGNATTVCSDKTGTLTANKMTAVQCYAFGIYYTKLSKRQLDFNFKIDNDNDYNDKNVSKIDKNTNTNKSNKDKHIAVHILAQNIALNSAYTSRIARDENNLIRQYGNKTECALLGFLYKLQYDYAKLRQEFPVNQIHRVFAFNSMRKLMRTIIKLPDDQGFRLLAKGASEIILRKCSFIIGVNGKLLRLNMIEKNKITQKVLKVMALNGLRTICLAYVDYIFQNDDDDDTTTTNTTNDEKKTTTNKSNCKMIKRNTEPDWDDEESYSNMTFLAVVGIEDPIRIDVAQAIKKFQKSGITVRMVTGDNIDTARSIAIKCGIINHSDNCNNNSINKKNQFMILDGKQFNQMIRNDTGEIDQDLFDQIWPNLRVLARSSPMDKYILVKHIIASKITSAREVVAVTGDGTNDAPALKMADVGFAMGIAGTEVAKEASDIILTDDNFSSIIKSVIWGRNVYDSIAKFIQFQLTVNIVAVLICFVSACIIQESPLRPVQMLWVNLIMDTLGSLALSTEEPDKSVLLRKPYGRNKPLISINMLKIIVGNALYQLIILIVFLFYGPQWLDFDSGLQFSRNTPTVHFTMLFNIFVMMTLFNEINSRKINGDRNVFEGLASNWMFCSIFSGTFFIQVCIVQFGSIWFNTSPLDLSQWLWCLAFGISIMIWGQIITTLTLKTSNYNWINGINNTTLTHRTATTHSTKRRNDD